MIPKRRICGKLNKKNLCLLLAIFLIFFTAREGFALQGADEEEEIKITIDGELFTMFFKEDIIVVEKSVRITYQDMIITAERAEYKREVEEVTIEDNVVVAQGENSVSGPHLWLDIEEEHIVFKDGVAAVYYHGEEGEEREPVYMWADTLEIWNKEGITSARGNVKAVYQEFTLTAQEALLDQEEETLTMSGNVFVEQEDGSWFSCQKAVYDLANEQLTAYSSESEKVRSEFNLPQK